MITDNSSKEIKVYNDKVFIDLLDELSNLRCEGDYFFLDSDYVNERKKKTIYDVWSDTIKIYHQINRHLKNKYPNNEVAQIMIAANNLSVKHLEEQMK